LVTVRVKWPIGSIASLLQTFREKLLAGLLWSGLSAVSLQGSNLLASALLARILGLEAFGAYALIVVTVSMLANFAQGGCGFVATKLVAENLGVNPTRISSTLRLCALLTGATGTAVTLLLIVWGPELSAHVLGRPELQGELGIAALSVLFQVSTTYQIGALQGFAAFKAISKASALSSLANIGCLVAGARFGGLQGALIGFTLANALRAIICWISLRVVRIHHGVIGDARIRREDVRQLWHIALPAGLAGLVTAPALWLVSLGISKLPEGLILVGIFTVATQIRQTALQLPTLLNSVTFVAMSRAKGADMRMEFKKVFFANLSANLVFGCIISAFVAATAQQILSLWNISSLESINTTRILAVSIVPELLTMSVYQLVQSSGRMWDSLLKISIPRDFSYLGVGWFFVPVYGLTAAAIAYLGAQLIALCATVITVWQAKTRVTKDVNPPPT
jgi:O-antigen/teichoic acid export membrane protein